MAITYDLDLATTAPAEDVAAALLACGVAAGLLPDDVDSAQLLAPDGVALASGLWLRTGAVPADDDPEEDPLFLDLGLRATVWVAFRMRAQAPLESQQRHMLRLVLDVLPRVDGDAVLHRQYEEIWLVRRDGQLTVSDDDAVWPSDRLQLLPAAYERAAVGFAGE